ncbi:MAG: LacI family transcriptional regulator [Lachnospiraceae bacterium]|nr:LacI family transcriptional regulator [Lachnospiraceae bacterium]
MSLKKKAVTIKDIAERTGFSANTVSRALRNKEDISIETREKIHEIAKQMGYVNNTLAASLRLGYTNTIAVILGDVSNPHFAIMMKEIEIHARGHGYASFLLNTNEDEELEFAAIKAALEKNVDGIIICPTQKSEKNLEFLRKSGVPFVLIGRRHPDYNNVVCNDEQGGYLATKALLEAGHERILLLLGPTYISSARERLEGYRRAYREAGIPVFEQLIREVEVTSQNVQDVLTQLEKEGETYTAIFAFSDMLAWSAWNCLSRQGKSVPKDCSLVGFDNIQSRMSLPFALTSIKSYKGRMSTETVELLVRQIRGNEETEQMVIDTALAEGETITAPRTQDA